MGRWVHGTRWWRGPVLAVLVFASLSTRPALGQTSPAPVRAIEGQSLRAVGPSQLVLSRGGKLVVTDRTGTEEYYTDDVDDWWSTRVGAPNRWPSHLQIAYDQDNQRWIAAACDPSNGYSGRSGVIWIALSQTDDFLGDWALFTFDELAVMGDEFIDLDYADYAPLQLGFGGGVVAVSVLLDDYDGRNETFQEDDSGFVIAGLGDIRGGGATPLTARQMTVSHEEFPYDEGRPVPARTYGPSSGLYFVSLEDVDPATYILSKMSYSGGSLKFSKEFASFEVGNLSADSGRVHASQPGTTVRLVHDDEWGMPSLKGHELIPEHRQIRDVVLRDKHLWVVHEGMDEDAAVVRTHWLCLNMSFWPWHVTQSGRLGGANGMSCIDPTLAVNADQDVLIGFTATGPHTFPSASYVYRKGSDALGAMRAVRHYVEGTGAYVNEHAFFPGVTRWPGRSRSLSDPGDPTGLWTHQTSMREGYATHIVQVTGNVPPVITAQPESRTVAPGGSASFTVGATGTTLQYQWFHEEAPTGGVQSSTFNVTGVNALKTGYYRCRVSNAGGVVWSAPALLKLTTGNPGVFSFVNTAGDDLTTQNWNEPSENPLIRPVRTLTIRRKNGSDGRVRVAVNVQGRFDPPSPSASAVWDYTGIQTPAPTSLFFRGPGALVFEAGETQKTVDVHLRRDTLVESPAETMEATLRVDPALGAVAVTPQLAITLLDNDTAPTFAQALDNTSLTFTNDGTRWKPQTTVTSDGVDAVQSDVSAAGGEPPEFWTSVSGAGTLVFRWRSEGDRDDHLQVLRRPALLQPTLVAQAIGTTPWHTTAVSVAEPLIGNTQVRWRFQRALGSTNPLASGYIDQVRFHPGTGGVVEFERPTYTVDEGAGTLRVTINRLGHTAQEGVVGVTLENGTAVGGSDFRPLALGLLTFAAGQTSRAITFTILPDELDEPVESFRAVLTRQGTGVIDIGPVGETTVSIANQPGETYQTWAATVFTPAQLGNAAISGPAANPDGDPLINLLEYAFAGNPLSPASAPLPTSTIESVPDEEIRRFLLSFQRRRHALDLVYTVQRSTDMLTWTDAATLGPNATTHLPSLVQLVSATGSPIETRLVRDTAPVAPGPPAWLRVKVSQP